MISAYRRCSVPKDFVQIVQGTRLSDSKNAQYIMEPLMNWVINPTDDPEFFMILHGLNVGTAGRAKDYMEFCDALDKAISRCLYVEEFDKAFEFSVISFATMLDLLISPTFAESIECFEDHRKTMAILRSTVGFMREKIKESFPEAVRDPNFISPVIGEISANYPEAFEAEEDVESKKTEALMALEFAKALVKVGQKAAEKAGKDKPMIGKSHGFNLPRWDSGLEEKRQQGDKE